MPAVSPEDMEAVKEIVKLKLKSKIMVFARAMAADIDNALECGVWGVVLEVPSGLPRLKYQFNWSEDEIIERSVQAIRYAKEKGLYVNFFPYDTTRAELPFLKRLCQEVASRSKPDSITVVDTTGCILPEGMKHLIREVKKISGGPVEVHTHNDFGLGTASSLAAVEAGAETVHVCVNGLGERCGNAALDEIAIGLRVLLDLPMEKIKFERLRGISQAVEKYAKVKLAANKPVVGDIAFTRESGLGMDVFKNEPRVAFALHPKFVDRKFEMVLGKKSGKPSIKAALEELGISVPEEKYGEILKKVKEKGADKKGVLTNEEFKEILKAVG
jgi:methanogen homocitrate synthase